MDIIDLVSYIGTPNSIIEMNEIGKMKMAQKIKCILHFDNNIIRTTALS